MKKQRKWAVGILLCIVAVVLAVWVGAAKDEKDSLDNGFGTLQVYAGFNFHLRKEYRKKK